LLFQSIRRIRYRLSSPKAAERFHKMEKNR
jgi:hypothetical protein